MIYHGTYDTAQIDRARRASWRTNSFRDSLRIGQRYTLRYQISEKGCSFENITEVQRITMPLVEMHEHVATFRHPKGWMESWDYWELSRILVG